MSDEGTELIRKERLRQVAEENFFAGSDDRYERGELWKAAIAYIFFNSPLFCRLSLEWWPWDMSWWKPDNTRAVRNLAKAGALIAAEIDRIQRIEARRKSSPPQAPAEQKEQRE